MKLLLSVIVAILVFSTAALADGPSLTAPKVISAGDNYLLRGRNFRGTSNFTIFAATDGKRVRIGWAITDPWGRFNAPIRTVNGMLPGKFRITVCLRGNCRAQRASTVVTVR